ncbi:hypothetical protein KGQ31_00095 [Patescibacteria group bacterium]|nr:hypothetical protein [Patescibacteria group bacterium]
MPHKLNTNQSAQRGLALLSSARQGLAVIMAFAPISVFALTTPKNLTDFVNNFIVILNYLIPFIVGFAFFGFMIGLLKYVGSGGDEERLSQGKQLIVYGLVGMVIAFSFWGLAKIIANTYLALGV